MSTDTSTSDSTLQQTSVRSPIFIVGQPRSGSTLLRSVLSSHSQITLVNEPDLIMGMRKAGYTIDDSFDVSSRGPLMDRLNRDRGVRRHLQSLDSAIIERFLQEEAVLGFKEVYERLLPRPANAVVWGDKTVGHSLFVIRDIMRLYPEALCIYIARDPRAMLLSTYRKRMAAASDRLPPFNRQSIAFFAYESMRWNKAMEALELAKRDCPEGSILEVSYERFVSEPQDQLRALLSEIGLTLEPDMLDETRRRDDPVLQDDCAFAHQNLNKAIDSSKAGSGEVLPEWASYVLHRCAEPSLRRNGHQIDARPTRFQRSVVEAGLWAYYSKMMRRLEREHAWYADECYAVGADG